VTHLLYPVVEHIAKIHGGYKVEHIWMIDHINLTNLPWNNKYLIVSSWWQNTHFVPPCQLRFIRLSLFGITPIWRYYRKTLGFSRIFIFWFFVITNQHVRLYYHSHWVHRECITLMESSENLPPSCRFQQNSQVLCVNWTKDKRCSKAFHDASLGPTRSLFNVTFCGVDPSTLAIVLLLGQTML
jgi:hypothetical protein